MAMGIVASAFPVSILRIVLCVLLNFILIHAGLSQDQSPSNFSTNNFYPPTMDESRVFDNWITLSMSAFKAREEEIKNGIDTAIDPQLQSAEKNPRIIKVRKDGTGDFKTVTSALKSIPEVNNKRVIIHIGGGVYTEKIQIDPAKKFITFYGDAKDMPTISFDGTAAKYGTMFSATVGVDSNYFMAVNIIFKNTAPMPADGAQDGQAVAFRINGDKAAFYNCKFYGYQDTLCDNVGRHYFKDCFIQGTVDFIFGNGRSLYEGCQINSVAKSVTAITAQGRETKDDKSGFSFLRCKITGTGNAYLSRAWRVSSRVVFAYTYMGNLIHPKGWDDKGDASRQKTVFYGEYRCSGPGAATEDRACYGKVLNDEQAKPFLSKTFIRGGTWILPPPKVA